MPYAHVHVCIELIVVVDTHRFCIIMFYKPGTVCYSIIAWSVRRFSSIQIRWLGTGTSGYNAITTTIDHDLCLWQWYVNQAQFLQYQSVFLLSVLGISTQSWWYHIQNPSQSTILPDSGSRQRQCTGATSYSWIRLTFLRFWASL